ncbi:hypothetical protein GCM10011371_21550 [Novosphingobium marinum]|uniref:Lipoprotein n=1 Tax=Novosphingobium marinum TaxID=1514948 RepID=A0A7Y9XX84_9SPHN|nr:hypothetical protein [Novosphingobium marinum]NYH96269.1 hypothetical protein [Novosphingobium marinum]GGC33808.1 hypothetical protein GCM10011371_21550 [Novosphingobium marinum]
MANRMVLAVALTLAACTSSGGGEVSSTPTPPPAETPYGVTRVLSETDARRLLENKGVTLQWIDWNTRGTAIVEPAEDAYWHLRAAQSEAGGPGRVFLDGDIVEIGEGYFTFDGTVRITDTPDRGRNCEADKTWHFAVTQNRPYYRLREFEWCDGLTDYVDIYF